MEKTKSFIENSTQRFITALVLGSLFWVVYFQCPPLVFSFLLGGILGAILFFEWHLLFSAKKIWYWLFMPVYPILPFGILIYCNHIPAYRILLYYACVITFTFDSFAYLVGTLLGSIKITPKISPSKTIEGFVGGFVAALGALYLALWQQNHLAHVHTSTLFILSFITCMLAFAGDAFESILKRKAGIKDTGILLPGHGGFLDRFDSLLMVSYALFIYKDYLAQLLQTF